MATENENETLTQRAAQGGTSPEAAAPTTQRVQLGIRLQPVEHSDRPVFANFASVQGAPGTVFVDFGFLEPSVLPGVARLAQSGGKVPETVNGLLVCRMALGVDAATQLAQQLDQHLRSLRPRPAQ